MADNGRILIVEDDPVQLELLGGWLEEWGYQVGRALDGAAGRQQLLTEPHDVVLLDVMLPDMDGLSLLEDRATAPGEPTFVITTIDHTVSRAVEAMRRGAHDYLLKPIRPDHLQLSLERLLAGRDQSREIGLLKQQLLRGESFAGILGSSRAMMAVFDRIAAAAGSAAPILITGETGAGKELVARAIHERSGRPGAFVAINCAGIADELLQAELFGHEKGAFTGAHQARTGLMRAAHEGSLFLDDIQSMPPRMQAALLRAVELQAVRPVGATSDTPTDFRLISATNIDLESLVAEEQFRADLYYRISTLPLRLPPLRERGDDVLLLAHHLLRDAGDLRAFSADAIDWLLRYEWPGNVRELKNLVQRAVAFGHGPQITGADLEPGSGTTEAGADPAPCGTPGAAAGGDDYRDAREHFERGYFGRLLDACDGSIAEVARASGLNRQYVYRKLKSLKIRE